MLSQFFFGTWAPVYEIRTLSEKLSQHSCDLSHSYRIPYVRSFIVGIGLLCEWKESSPSPGFGVLPMKILKVAEKLKPTAVVAALLYCLLSAAWIFITDKLISLLDLTPQAMTRWSMAKGLVYVGVSGAFIFFVLKRLHDLNRELEHIVAGRTAALQEKQHVLQRQADILKSLIECAPVGLAMLDKKMRYLEVSDRWCKEYSLERAAILGKSHYEVFPNLPERWKGFHQRALAGEVSRSELDQFTDATGREHWIRWEVRPWGENSEPGGIIIFTEDITDRRLLERQLLQAQKMESVGRLAGGVAHDFNNLLMIIRMNTELLMLDTADSEQFIRHAQQILEASDRAASVTRQLLAFSRTQKVELRLVDINSIVRDFCAMLPTLVGEDIELVVNPAATAWTVRVDPSQVELVIMNLAVNARDAMPNGGRLTIETSLATISSTDAAGGAPQIPAGVYVVLAVSDTGCGMDQNTKERIFEPFFTTKPVGKGTGLGLSTVYGIVQQSKGHILLNSEPGCGTTFRIYLPWAEERPVLEPTDERDPGASINGTATILLVEDQGGLRNVMSEYLRARGFRVLCAEDGNSALQIASSRKDPIHLVLADVIMPGMRGTEVSRRVMEIHPEAKVLLMSGYPGPAMELADIENEIILQKPIPLGTLVAKIEDILRLTDSSAVS